MSRSRFLFLFLLVAISAAPTFVAQANMIDSVHRKDYSASTPIDAFNITLTNLTTVSITAYAGRPTVISWAASWCSTCKANMKTMNEIFSHYSSIFSYLSISFGGSGDDIAKVQGLKDIGPYNWDFGLDIDNYAATKSASNGHVWILASDLSLHKAWGYTIVPKAQLVDSMNELTPEESRLTLSITTNPLDFLPLSNPLFITFFLGAAAFAALVSVVRLRKK